MDLAAPQSPAPTPTPRSKRLKVILVWTIIITGLISGVYLLIVNGYLGLSGVAVSALPANLTLSLPSPEGDTLYAFTHTKGAIVLVPDASLAPRSVVAAVSGGGAHYYLLRTEGATNLYRVASSTTATTLLTNTSSRKSGLSYDAPSHTLAFAVASTSSASSIVVFDTTTGASKVVGKGSDPVVLPSGINILARSGNSISVINRLTGTETPLLSVATSAPFAVAPDGLSLALYNAAAHKIDYFDIRNITSANYLRSVPAPFATTAMTFNGTQLYLAGPSGKAREYVIQVAGNAVPLGTFLLPEASEHPDRLLFQ